MVPRCRCLASYDGDRLDAHLACQQAAFYLLRGAWCLQDVLPVHACCTSAFATVRLMSGVSGTLCGAWCVVRVVCGVYGVCGVCSHGGQHSCSGSHPRARRCCTVSLPPCCIQCYTCSCSLRIVSPCSCCCSCCMRARRCVHLCALLTGKRM